MAKKAGMMEIAFKNGVIRADAKAGMICMTSLENNIGKSREDIFKEHLADVQYLMFGDMIGGDVITIFQEELKITNEDILVLNNIVKNKSIITDLLENPIKKVMDRNDEAQFDNKEDSGVVYLLSASDRLKIGKTKNVKQRINALRTGCPYPIECLGFIETNECTKLEKALHEKFSQFRINGEWFEKNSCIISYFKSGLKFKRS